MTNDPLARELRQLREELVQTGLGVMRNRWRCPEDLKSKVIAYAHSCQRQGQSLTRTAAQLGMGEKTLRQWVRQDLVEDRGERTEGIEGFRQVSIVAGNPDAEGANRPAKGLTLTTSGGHRVEGLDVKSAAYLLRVLS
jgi:transposase-like protein